MFEVPGSVVPAQIFPSNLPTQQLRGCPPLPAVASRWSTGCLEQRPRHAPVASLGGANTTWWWRARAFCPPKYMTTIQVYLRLDEFDAFFFKGGIRSTQIPANTHGIFLFATNMSISFKQKCCVARVWQWFFGATKPTMQLNGSHREGRMHIPQLNGYQQMMELGKCSQIRWRILRGHDKLLINQYMGVASHPSFPGTVYLSFQCLEGLPPAGCFQSCFFPNEKIFEGTEFLAGYPPHPPSATLPETNIFAPGHEWLGY